MVALGIIRVLLFRNYGFFLLPGGGFLGFSTSLIFNLLINIITGLVKNWSFVGIYRQGSRLSRNNYGVSITSLLFALIHLSGSLFTVGYKLRRSF